MDQVAFYDLKVIIFKVVNLIISGNNTQNICKKC